MENIEKPGYFYLGKKTDKQPLLYASKDFTTHAMCVGMTGSGKSGLGIAILEEAALDKIPAIVIDPKGDLTNLFLTFPSLSAEEFRPWIDEQEAEKEGLTPEKYAEKVANSWKKGLAEWNEDGDRIKRFRDAVELAVYTPASEAGLSISILDSFAAPSKEELLDSSAIREKIMSLTSSLLGLVGEDTDPLKSREHILLSTIIQDAWKKGTNLDFSMLIQQIQKPKFTKIGALDIETFYPAKERMQLSIKLNSLLASPGFHAWLEGEPLDIAQLLYTPQGKPKISIISIAHLGDSERMFFVTLLLNELVSWMRRQPGTSSLRALLYMDEIFGFFPPTAAPPSKLPMLTLLKQARAFGLGVILATQNPVDLDYKGLSNCGTWFIGKLQTERDKQRVLEGLKMASNGESNTAQIDRILAQLGKRTFLMRSIHEEQPIVFQTRWTLSYLRGPLTLKQIATLVSKPTKTAKKKKTATTARISIPPGIEEFFINMPDAQLQVEPRVLGLAKIHFVDSKNKIDVWKEINFIAPLEDDGSSVAWEKGINVTDLKEYLKSTPLPGSEFDEVPSALLQPKNYAVYGKQLCLALYQNQTYILFQAEEMVSQPDESETEFRQRVSAQMFENKDESIKTIHDKYAEKLEGIKEKLQRAQEKKAQRAEKAGNQRLSTWISIGSTLLGTLFGRGVTKGTITQTGNTLKRATKLGKESESVTQADNEIALWEQKIAQLESEMNQEIAALESSFQPDQLEIKEISIKPKKSDISIEKMAIAWWPKK